MGIDLDGVLADFNRSFINLVREQTGINLPAVSDFYPDVWAYHLAGGVTDKQDDQLWEHIKATSFWGSLQPLPGALDAIKSLRLLRFDGHDIYFITSRPGKKAKFQTEFWLKMCGMYDPTVLIAYKKGAIAANLHLDIFIDDRPENCLDVLMASPRTRIYLVDAPYNRHVHASYFRVKDVNEVLRIENQRLFPPVTLQEAA